MDAMTVTWTSVADVAHPAFLRGRVPATTPADFRGQVRPQVATTGAERIATFPTSPSGTRRRRLPV